MANFEWPEDVWLDVEVEEVFSEVWPPPTLPDGTPGLPTPVIAVDADEWPRVDFDLIGVRGAYSWCALFPPKIDFVSHSRYVATPQADYLYNYEADPNSYKLVEYDVTYLTGEKETHCVRVWQNLNHGRDWIIRRVAYEQARDAQWAQGLSLPASPGLPCLP